MAKVTIAANKKHKALLSSINEHVLQKHAEIKVVEKDNTIVLDFTKKKKEIMSLLAMTITSYIIIHIDDTLIRDTAGDEAFDLPDEEFDYLVATIKTNILQEGDLYSEVLFMLDESKVFNLTGFLNFRNKDRRNDIREISHRAVQEFFSAIETEGFIHLVKRFIYIQLPKTEYVHIVEQEDGTIDVFTSDNEKINFETLREELEENLKETDFEVTEFDLILSSMMSLLPKKVYLHFPHEVDIDMCYTLQRMFEGRAEECGGCGQCGAENQDEEMEEPKE